MRCFCFLVCASVWRAGGPVWAASCWRWEAVGGGRVHDASCKGRKVKRPGWLLTQHYRKIIYSVLVVGFHMSLAITKPPSTRSFILGIKYRHRTLPTLAKIISIYLFCYRINYFCSVSFCVTWSWDLITLKWEKLYHNCVSSIFQHLYICIFLLNSNTPVQYHKAPTYLGAATW